MSKITFLGAGSTAFAKNVLDDCMLTPALQGFELALFDIGPGRLKDSKHIYPILKKRRGVAVLTNVMNVHGGVRKVGLCHSVQACIPELFKSFGLEQEGVKEKIACINHMACMSSYIKLGVQVCMYDL